MDISGKKIYIAPLETLSGEKGQPLFPDYSPWMTNNMLASTVLSALLLWLCHSPAAQYENVKVVTVQDVTTVRGFCYLYPRLFNSTLYLKRECESWTCYYRQKKVEKWKCTELPPNCTKTNEGALFPECCKRTCAPNTTRTRHVAGRTAGRNIWPRSQQFCPFDRLTATNMLRNAQVPNYDGWRLHYD